MTTRKQSQADAGDELGFDIVLSHAYGNAAGARSPPIMFTASTSSIADWNYAVFTSLQDPGLVRDNTDTLYRIRYYDQTSLLHRQPRPPWPEANRQP